MKNNKYRIISLFIIILLLFPVSTFAHKGRTDGYGGHYDREKGTYHYHSGEYAGTGEYTAPVERGGVLIDADAYYTNTNDKEETTISRETSSNKNVNSKSLSTPYNNSSIEEENSKTSNTLLYLCLFMFIGVPIIYSIIQYIYEIIVDVKKEKTTNTSTNTSDNVSTTMNNNSVKSKNNNYYRTNSNYYKCPRCGGQLQVKNGRYGKFIGCKNYPYCKYTRSIK